MSWNTPAYDMWHIIYFILWTKKEFVERSLGLERVGTRASLIVNRISFLESPR